MLKEETTNNDTLYILVEHIQTRLVFVVIGIACLLIDLDNKLCPTFLPFLSGLYLQAYLIW